MTMNAISRTEGCGTRHGSRANPVTGIEPAVPIDTRPLVLHLVYRFDVGGLENGIVNLLNHMPRSAYRHVVVALSEVTDFRGRVERDDIEFIALHKPPGHGLWIYPTLFRLFRRLRPAIVHSRNLAALEAVIPAWLAGVPVRIHGEHGRDVDDLHGKSRRHQWMRRIYRPFVDHYCALSRELSDYLVGQIGIPRGRVTQVYNGVDSACFHPAGIDRPAIVGCPFRSPEHWLVGTVGRMQTVKHQVGLAHAFVRALELQPTLRARLRLAMVGDGPLRAESLAILDAAGVSDLAWLPGARHDVAEIMRGLNCFVLPSLAEGVSNTILEAMASGLPVIATDVGGNAELVAHGLTGEIVPAADPNALARSLIRFAGDPALALTMGRAGRAAVESRFGLPAMVSAYQSLYDRQLRA